MASQEFLNRIKAEPGVPGVTLTLIMDIERLQESLRQMVQEHCTGPGGRLMDYGNPTHHQALETLEKAGILVKVKSGSHVFWEWAG